MEVLLAVAESMALVGADAYLVKVEIHVHEGGLPVMRIVGLPAKSVQEAEQRTRSAIVSSNYKWPGKRIVANLAPGALRKEGTHFDLSIALGVLAGDGWLDPGLLRDWIFVGELGLDGSVRPVRGVLPAAICCQAEGRRGIFCPSANAAEAAIISGIEVVGVSSLLECVEVLRGERTPRAIEPHAPPIGRSFEDLRDVRGHEVPKRALEIAASGGHNLLMEGSPGCGKTMLASRLPGILPSMSERESLALTKLHSIAGLLGEKASLVVDRPFRAPHHSISLAGMVGGGSGLPRPGEVSLAANGVLFLDELPLYRSEVLESLRGPLEDGVVRISRSGGTVRFDCRFTLIAAMNPCMCGNADDRYKECRCSPLDVRRYRNRISGPLMDRIDLRVGMERLGRKELLGPPTGEDSASVRARVERAHAIQSERYGGGGITNASASKDQLDRLILLASSTRSELGDGIDRWHLSGRAVDRILRVARTIADMAGNEVVDDEALGEALSYRLTDEHGREAA